MGSLEESFAFGPIARSPQLGAAEATYVGSLSSHYARRQTEAAERKISEVKDLKIERHELGRRRRIAKARLEREGTKGPP